MEAELLGLIIGSLFSIMAYTVLLGDNPISKVTENIYMGILGGYTVSMQIDYINRNAVTKIGGGQYIYVLSLILSIMMLGRLSRKWMWVSRYPVVLTVGVGLGLAIRTTVTADFLNQIKATILPLNSLNNIVMVVGTVAATAYFLFTREFTGNARYINNLGRAFLLAAFGVTYGQTVSFRFELVIGRLVAMLKPEVISYTAGFIVLISAILIFGYKTKRITWYSAR